MSDNTSESLEIVDVAPEQGNRQPELLSVRQGMFGISGSGDTTGFGGQRETVYVSLPARRPYGSWFDTVVDLLEEDLNELPIDPIDVIEKVVIDRDELTIFVAREHIRTVVTYLRNDQDLRFEMCLGTNGVHYPHDAGREFHAIYPFLSMTHNRLVRLEVTCPQDDPHIPSIVDIYPTNDWQERETWDLLGIIFDGHPALTRTALPDDWVGHPLRKDYPLGGIPVEYRGATVPPADVRRAYHS